MHVWAIKKIEKYHELENKETIFSKDFLFDLKITENEVFDRLIADNKIS